MGPMSCGSRILATATGISHKKGGKRKDKEERQRGMKRQNQIHSQGKCHSQEGKSELLFAVQGNVFQPNLPQPLSPGMHLHLFSTFSFTHNYPSEKHSSSKNKRCFVRGLDTVLNPLCNIMIIHPTISKICVSSSCGDYHSL